ncbi:hypothetical protein BDZ85DRAFT_230643 [Elsinoe ampelina]|uniref:FAD-binding domain-containing protein n=1 Tax=Elsinoe ampelina TaxID=302913 RepID=A0A6A6GM81_9PEZI|nr:hypothetical protein BDZ85DRAFT_230643 [Elsinoe ampelina]
MAEQQQSPVPSPDQIKVEHAQVIIVGAGPVGLFSALKMVQAGIDVIILEAEKGIIQSPRATTYMPITLHEMEQVGVYADLEAAGFKNRGGITFRESHAKGGEVLAQLKMSVVPKGSVKYDFAGIHLGQHSLAEILLRHCEKHTNFKVLWGHRFAGAQQDDDAGGITVAAVGPVGERFFTGDYLVGADGAGSAVRRSLCIPFEGFTWQDFRFVACNVKYDFEGLAGFSTANMVVDEEDWAVIARTGREDAPWRVALGVRTDVPESEILNQLPGKFERLFPGPRPLKYEIVSANPYWAHQRIASKLKVGRIVLCGDAAHHLLERYAEVRKEAWVKYTNPGSIDFKMRVHSTHPDAVASREKFFGALNNDPDIHLKMATMMNEVIQDEFSLPE